MEKLGEGEEKREVLSKDQLISEYLLPTVEAVVERSKHQVVDYDPDFYSLEFDHENGDISTYISFETDDPEDKKFYIDIDMTHTESSSIISLPTKEMLHTMELLEKNIHTRNSKKIYELSRMIRDGDIDAMGLQRSTIVDVGFSVDMSTESVDIIKTKVYRTMVEDIEIDRIAIGVSEESTPLGLCRLEIDADDEDYKTIALACQLIQSKAANS